MATTQGRTRLRVGSWEGDGVKRSAISRRPKKRKPPKRPNCDIRGCTKRIRDEHLCAKHLTLRADKLARAVVMERDLVCRRCGTLQMGQWAHVVSRRYRALRWSPDNAVRLCRDCHAWQGGNPLEGDAFFETLGIDLAALKLRALNSEPEDPADVVRRLS